MNNFYNKFIAKRRWLKRILVNTLDDRARLDLKDNYKLYYDPKDFRGPSFHVVYSGDFGFEHYEQKEKNALADALPDDGVFFDIGANIGLFTFYIKQKKPNIVTHCFEPHPNLVKCMQNTISDNEISDVIINEVGLSDTNGQFKLFLSNRNAGGHSLKNYGTDKSEDSFHMVKVTTIDNYCQDNGIDRIDVMKIDVEGLEEQVLNGAVETFSKHKPALMIECSNEEIISGEGVLTFFEKNNLNVVYRAIHQPEYLNIDTIKVTAQEFLDRGVLIDNYLFKFI